MLTELQKQITSLLNKKDFVLVAIDGNCSAGKTTLAAVLSQQFDCNVFHMDHFFLRPEQRTPERFAEAGGNVDYERFYTEVLLPLNTRAAFSYRPYDCGTCQLSDAINVEPKQLNIVEGTYSLHPYFGDCYDLKVFLKITPALQRERILQRPPALHRRFFEEWIPMEQQYFDLLSIASGCDLVINIP